MYAGKIQGLYEFGKNLSWEPEIFKKIKPIIDSTKQRMREKLNKQTQ